MSEIIAKKDPAKRRIFYIILFILALVITIWAGSALLKRYRARKALEEKERAGQAVLDRPKDDIGMHTPELEDDFPLMKGSRGDRVSYLQKAINKINRVYGKPKISEDGLFGESTYGAVLQQGTRYYPVTQESWTELLNRANKLSA